MMYTLHGCPRCDRPCYCSVLDCEHRCGGATISICVPYWNRQAALDRMFVNYTQMYEGFPFEFSVCDDGSPVPAVLPNLPPYHYVLTRLPAKKKALNPCVPINQAVAASSGEMIVLTNAEIQHTTPILLEMLELCETTDSTYVVAQCYDTRYRGRKIWLAGPKVNSKGREVSPPGGYFHFLAMLRRTLWDRVGGFDEDYRMGKACDDNDWLWRLYEAGAQFVTTEQACWHEPVAGCTWRIPHNSNLFNRKWPPARRAALIKEREG